MNEFFIFPHKLQNTTEEKLALEFMYHRMKHVDDNLKHITYLHVKRFPQFEKFSHLIKPEDMPVENRMYEIRACYLFRSILVLCSYKGKIVYYPTCKRPQWFDYDIEEESRIRHVTNNFEISPMGLAKCDKCKTQVCVITPSLRSKGNIHAAYRAHVDNNHCCGYDYDFVGIFCSSCKANLDKTNYQTRTYAIQKKMRLEKKEESKPSE